jgi:serine/threonine-protein kinase
MTGARRHDLARELTIGDWRVRPLLGLIERGSRSVRLQPRVMELLLRLARSPGEVVTRDELFSDVWAGVVVSDDVLTRCVSNLRAALGDARHGRHHVVTVAKRGYVLKAPVAWLVRAGERESARREESIAVLPFGDLSAEPGFGWFAAGLTDALMDSLARIPGLRVAARTSALAVQDARGDVRAIGARLGVRHVLEGSVSREGEQVRVAIRLASAHDGFQLWAETVTAEARDVHGLQRALASGVAGRLALRIGERTLSGSAPAGVRLEAWAHYVRARELYHAERPSFRYEGVAELERAIALDPRFAAAHGLHAYVHALRAAHEEPYPRVAERVRASLQRALALDPLQPEALMAKAIDVRWRSWDWLEVRQLFEQALHVAPGDPHVLAHFAARYFRDLGELGVAERLLRRASEIDPLNPMPRAQLSSVLRFSGDARGARDEAERALALSPSHSWALQAALLAQIEASDFAGADATLRQVAAAAGIDHRMTLEARGRLEARSGHAASARKTLARLRSFARENAIYTDAAAWVCFELGEIDEGAEWLERGIAAGVAACATARACALPIDARTQLLRAPRFQAALARMRLDDVSLAALAAEGALDPPAALRSWAAHGTLD